MIFYVLLTYFVFTYLYLEPYFISKIGKELFNGTKYDYQVLLLFGWMLPFRKFVNGVRYVILCDQVSRHVRRKVDIGTFSDEACDYVSTLKLENYDVNELTLFGLCVRHQLNKVSTQSLSSLLSTLISLIDMKMKDIDSINEHNRRELRCNNTKKLTSDTFIQTPYVRNDELVGFVWDKFVKFVPSNSHIVVMCSGGVDSMTLAHVCEELSHRCVYKFLIFHINWRKRLESTREAIALKLYFENFQTPFLSVDCHIDKNDPNWDAKTTEFRLGCMKTIKETYENDTYFVMGHVITDLIENLFMNGLLNNSKGTNLLTIFGMKELSVINELNVLRPLLLHEKPNGVSHLFDNAEELNVARRTYRRALPEFSVERVRQLYYQSIELQTFFNQPLPYPLFNTAPPIAIQQYMTGIPLKQISHIQEMLRAKVKNGKCPVVRNMNGREVKIENGNVVLN